MNRVKSLRNRTILILLIGAAGFTLTAVAPGVWQPAKAQSVVANPPYSVSIFATSVPGQYTQPGAIAFSND
ncbi:MAG TPA: hypothetical protein VEZ90_15460, partial [Blastocatellia bacterium]|nr:hypothetical protein [Blastocatellia bacterium]